MPRLIHQVPRYRKHRASGQAVVTLHGKDLYLGPHRSRASLLEYDRLVGEWLANSRQLPPSPEQNSITVTALAAAYWRFAKSYYRKDGQPTSTLIRVRVALRLLRRLYGKTPVDEFGPVALRSIQHRLAGDHKCRRYVNHLVQQIKRVFRWGASHELVLTIVFQGLATVEGLRKGRSEARETEAIAPVPAEVVETTLPCLLPVVADMVRFQRLTGCRPGEVCRLRPGDIDRTGKLWQYRPTRHKTEHHGRERIIVIGPKAQEILQPYLERSNDHYCFSPRDSETQHLVARRASRKTPLSCGNRPGTNRVTHRKRTAGDCYTASSYMRAVVRACEIAFGMPKELRIIDRKLNPDEQRELRSAAAKWRRANCWHPNQLRHSAATEIRKQFGLEAAQVTLGHASANITQVYAERDISLAMRVMSEVG